MFTEHNTSSLDELKENINKFLTSNNKQEPLYVFDNSITLGVFLDINQYNNIKELIEDALDVKEIRATDKMDLLELKKYHINRMKL